MFLIWNVKGVLHTIVLLLPHRSPSVEKKTRTSCVKSVELLLPFFTAYLVRSTKYSQKEYLVERHNHKTFLALPYTVAYNMIIVRNKRIVFGGILLVVLSIFVAFALHGSNKKQTVTTVQDPASSLIAEAAKYLNDSKETAKLADVAQRITQLSGYQTNADLLYIVTISAINTSDLSAAQSNLALLKKVYQPSVGYGQILRPLAYDLDSLSNKVDILAKQIDQFKKNSYGIAIPDGGQ
jgi:hypothetical protein